MATTPSGFKVLDGTRQVDLDELLVDKDIFSEGNLWLWGENLGGQLGANDRTSRSSPIQTVAGGTNWKQVVGGAAGIKTDGTLWMWGYNNYGQLGTNDTTPRSSPVQTVAGGTNWKQATQLGNSHAAAIKTDGTLWVWGLNTSGQLGVNDITNRSSPVQTVAGGTNWKQVSCNLHTVAIKTDGTLWTWGRNTYGQLGTNDITDRSSPVQTVAGGTLWKQAIVGGVAASGQCVAAIKTDGTLWLWGSNANGQLGTNDITDRSSPVQTVAGGTNWKQVSAGGTAVAAIKTDGTLWVWGDNTYGQLGTNDITHRSSPVQTVAGGTNWKQVSAGAYHMVAIKTDGTMWTWGRNDYGQLGTNNTTYRSSPVQTVAGGTNWKQATMTSNSWSTAALKYN
jgi:alpha-tubulin suppressor-like RCC1 family protein